MMMGLLDATSIKSAGGVLSFTFQTGSFVTGTPAPNSSMFTNLAIGTSAADRNIVLGISWKGTNAAGMDIPSSGVTINGAAVSQAVYSRPSVIGQAIYNALVTISSVASIGITGYSNGFIDEIFVEVATVTGSATMTSTNIDVTPTYSNGLTTSPNISVPSNGVSVIQNVVVANGGTTIGSSWFGATVDNEQWDGNNFGFGSAMLHLTVSSSVKENNVPGGGPTGWVVAGFKP